MGNIKTIEGNMMPSVGKQNNSKTIITRKQILIYKLLNTEEIKANGNYYDYPKSNAINKVKTNKQGNYKIALPIGKYSVFVNDKKGLFANKYDGLGFVNPVEVKKDQLTNFDITIDNDAFY